MYKKKHCNLIFITYENDLDAALAILVPQHPFRHFKPLSTKTINVLRLMEQLGTVLPSSNRWSAPTMPAILFTNYMIGIILSRK